MSWGPCDYFLCLISSDLITFYLLYWTDIRYTHIHNNKRILFNLNCRWNPLRKAKIRLTVFTWKQKNKSKKLSELFSCLNLVFTLVFGKAYDVYMYVYMYVCIYVQCLVKMSWVELSSNLWFDVKIKDALSTFVNVNKR